MFLSRCCFTSIESSCRFTFHCTSQTALHLQSLMNASHPSWSLYLAFEVIPLCTSLSVLFRPIWWSTLLPCSPAPPPLCQQPLVFLPARTTIPPSRCRSPALPQLLWKPKLASTLWKVWASTLQLRSRPCRALTRFAFGSHRFGSSLPPPTISGSPQLRSLRWWL